MTLETMRNWQEEIVNYHQCRWTNATVEGRHNRIKAYHYQRRHYFIRHYGRYKAGILVECNRHRIPADCQALIIGLSQNYSSKIIQGNGARDFFNR